MGETWTDVNLYKPLTFLGLFDRSIKVPKICCKCLNHATKEESIQTSFPDPNNDQITHRVGFNFLYCKKCNIKANIIAALGVLMFFIGGMGLLIAYVSSAEAFIWVIGIIFIILGYPFIFLHDK
jgi:hypothetical protein